MNNKAIVLIEIGDWFCFRKSKPIYEAAEKLNIKTIRVAKSNRFRHDNEISIINDMSNLDHLAEQIYALGYDVIEVISTSDFLFNHGFELKKRFNLLEDSNNNVMRISDKDKLFHLLVEEGLPVLKQSSPINKHDLLGFENTSIILKPSLSTGGVKRKEWDYQVFSNISEISEEVLKGIYEQNLNEQRKTIVQQFVENPVCLDIHFILDSNFKSHVFLKAMTNTNRKKNAFMILESWGVVSLPETVELKIKNFLLVIEKMKIKNVIFNAQFVIAENEIYLIDLNLRCAGIWTALYAHMMPDFFEQYLKMILKFNFVFKLEKPYYLKCPIYLNTGRVVKNVIWPSVEFREELLYKENVKIGEVVGENINSIQPSPQVFFIANTMSECFSKGKEFFNNLKVDYE